MSPSKIQGYVQDTTITRRDRSKKRARTQLNTNTTPQSGTSTPRPGMNVYPSPESGISTRYHSAESLLVGSTPGSFATPIAINTFKTPDQATGLGEEVEKEKKAKEKTWPDVLIVTGLEDCESPLQIKLFDLVKLSKMEKEDEMLVIWVRDEEKSETAPAWLVRIISYERHVS
jgi:hypothetical protein